MCTLHLWEILKRQPSHCNDFFRKWLPTITIVGVFLPLWLTLGIYQSESVLKSNLLRIAFHADVCKNLDVAIIHKAVEVGGQYQIGAEYDTSFIKNNFSDLYIYFDQNGWNPNLLFQAIQIMDRTNTILSNQMHLPSSEIVIGGGQIVELFREMGYRYNSAYSCQTPDYLKIPLPAVPT